MTTTRNNKAHRERLPHGTRLVTGLLSAILLFVPAINANAQAQPEPRPSMDLYGYTMLDFGYDFRTINPDWFDTMRPSQLPSFEGEFGKNYRVFAGVRQTRFGVKTAVPTMMGEMKTTFEFELFGVGVDAGQTTFRLRHAYGELGPILAGQTWSVFMDPDVFPNSLEYWGPNGMVFFRNVQFRWTPIQGDTNLAIALERPGGSSDLGRLQDRIELQNVLVRFPLPDLTAAFQYRRDWGYVRAAGVLRRISWDDTLNNQFDLAGHVTGWGVNVSSNLNLRANKGTVLKLQATYGKGMENYMNDAPADVGVVPNPGNPLTPVTGKALPVWAVVAFIDHQWSEKFSSSAGYSRLEIDNTIGQLPAAFRTGGYALGNLLYYPVPNVMMGGEFQWGRRDNFSDGFDFDGMKLQFSFRYNFSHKIGG